MFIELEQHITDGTKPALNDRSVPTLASSGLQLKKDEIRARQSSRGLKRKPHHIHEEDIEEEGARRRRKK